MKTLGLELELLAPALLAASPPAGNLTETLTHVPGNSVRGLLAWRYLEVGGSPKDESFRRLFVRGEGRFGDALPAGAEVLPLSARSCKYDRGFLGEPGGHGVRDLLLAKGESAVCDGCGAPLDYFHGFWKPSGPSRLDVRRRLRTRTAIDPERGTARTGQLFTQEVVEEGQRFTGSVEVPADLADVLEELVAEPFEGAVGTGASRGQGWLRAHRCDPVERDLGPARGRFERFRELWGSPVLGVTLLSDALLRDEFLRDRSAPVPADLETLGIRAADWKDEPVAAFLDVRNVFGFDGEPVHLPRPVRRVVTAGSCFLFEAREGAERPEVADGPGVGWIGEGQDEGFGRAALWHPFHLEPDRSVGEGGEA